MIFHENHLAADNSHEISCLICYFWKSSKIWNRHLLQIIGGALGINMVMQSLQFLAGNNHSSLCCQPFPVGRTVSSYEALWNHRLLPHQQTHAQSCLNQNLWKQIQTMISVLKFWTIISFSTLIKCWISELGIIKCLSESHGTVQCL